MYFMTHHLVQPLRKAHFETFAMKTIQWQKVSHPCQISLETSRDFCKTVLVTIYDCHAEDLKKTPTFKEYLWIYVFIRKFYNRLYWGT